MVKAYEGTCAVTRLRIVNGGGRVEAQAATHLGASPTEGPGHRFKTASRSRPRATGSSTATSSASPTTTACWSRTTASRASSAASSRRRKSVFTSLVMSGSGRGASTSCGTASDSRAGSRRVDTLLAVLAREATPSAHVGLPVAWGLGTRLRTIPSAPWGTESQMTLVHEGDIWIDPSDGYSVRVVRFSLQRRARGRRMHHGIQLPHRTSLV